MLLFIAFQIAVVVSSDTSTKICQEATGQLAKKQLPSTSGFLQIYRELIQDLPLESLVEIRDAGARDRMAYLNLPTSKVASRLSKLIERSWKLAEFQKKKHKLSQINTFYRRDLPDGLKEALNSRIRELAYGRQLEGKWPLYLIESDLPLKKRELFKTPIIGNFEQQQLFDAMTAVLNIGERQLAGGSKYGGAFLHDFGGRRLERFIRGSVVESMAITPSKNIIAVSILRGGDEFPRPVDMIEIRSASGLKLQQNFSPAKEAPVFMHFTSDTTLVTIESTRMVIYKLTDVEASDQVEIPFPEGITPTAFAASTNGEDIAIGFSDGSRALKLRGENGLRNLRLPELSSAHRHSEGITQIKFEPNGDILFFSKIDGVTTRWSY